MVCVVTGMALGADLSLPPSMQADVVDFDTLRTGQRRAGMFFALWSMSTKLALGGAALIAFPALDMLGFDPAADGPKQGIVALAVIYAVVPVVFKLCAIATIWHHPITRRRHDAIKRRLRTPSPPARRRRSVDLGNRMMRPRRPHRPVGLDPSFRM